MVKENLEIKRLEARAKKFKPQIASIHQTLDLVALNKPEKFNVSQRVLVKQKLLRPKKRFRKGGSALTFTKEGRRFFLASKKFRRKIQ